MGATEVLSAFIAEAKYEDLPVEVIQAAKVGIMDGVANMLAGSAQPLSTIISDYVRGLGGTPQCTISRIWIQVESPVRCLCQRRVRSLPRLRDTGLPANARNIVLPSGGAGSGGNY